MTTSRSRPRPTSPTRPPVRRLTCASARGSTSTPSRPTLLAPLSSAACALTGAGGSRGTATPTAWPTPSPTPCSARRGSAISGPTFPTPIPPSPGRTASRSSAPSSPSPPRGPRRGQRRLHHRRRRAAHGTPRRCHGREPRAALGAPVSVKATRAEGSGRSGEPRDRVHGRRAARRLFGGPSGCAVSPPKGRRKPPPSKQKGHPPAGRPGRWPWPDRRQAEPSRWRRTVAPERRSGRRSASGELGGTRWRAAGPCSNCSQPGADRSAGCSWPTASTPRASSTRSRRSPTAAGSASRPWPGASRQRGPHRGATGRARLCRADRADTARGPVPPNPVRPTALLAGGGGHHDPRNLGALLRSAECAGVTGVVLPRHRAAHLSPTVAKVAAGALEHLDFCVVGGIPAALDEDDQGGVWTVGLAGEAERSIYSLPLGEVAVALVMGSEEKGSRPSCAAAATSSWPSPARQPGVAQRRRGRRGGVLRGGAPARGGGRRGLKRLRGRGELGRARRAPTRGDGDLGHALGAGVALGLLLGDGAMRFMSAFTGFTTKKNSTAATITNVSTALKKEP